MTRLSLPQLLFWLILAGALLLRIALWLQPLHQPANDEVEYIAVARDLLAGRGWIFYERYHWLRAPLYPLFLAASLWLSGGDLWLAALPNMLLSVLLVGLIGALAGELVFEKAEGRRQKAGDRRQEKEELAHDDAAWARVWAAGLAALLMTYATFSALYMSETLFSALFCAALLLLVRVQRRALPGSSFSVHIALAGMCFGLACLTRSAALMFAPVVMLWLVAQDHQSAAPSARSAVRITRSLPAALLFGVCIALVIAPWTIRNCRAYGECILIETGLSFNTWAFNEPREDRATIYRTLEQITNPAERAAEATQRGVERLREDPLILLRKLFPNWVALWTIKPIEDRFLMPNYFADPPPLVFLAGLVLDDLLYILIVVLGVFGLWRGLLRRDWAFVLLALWPVYILTTTMLTHGESRYRHFFFMVLIAAAGYFRAQNPEPTTHNPEPTTHNPEPTTHNPEPTTHNPEPGANDLESEARQAAHRGRSGSQVAGRGSLVPWFLSCAIILTVLNWYPWQWAIGGSVRSVQRYLGDWAGARGDAVAAERHYLAALAASPSSDGWIALGNLYRAQGELMRAERSYRIAWERSPRYMGASGTLGDLLRQQGRDDEARVAFSGRYTPDERMVSWTYDNLAVQKNVVDVGNKLDFGYINGVYAAEEQQGATARWTNGSARLRLAGTAESGVALFTLRLAAPHPNSDRLPLKICSAASCTTVELGPTWRTIRLLVPVEESEAHEFRLETPTFNAPDGRELGVLIDWVWIEQVVQ